MIIFLFLLLGMLMCASHTYAQDATSLKARYIALQDALAHNQFNRPLYLESNQQNHKLEGDIYSLIQQPYSVVGPALQDINHWCDILILHLNVKSCQAFSSASGDTLNLYVGRKFDQPLKDAYPFQFSYNVMVKQPDYLQLTLNAPQGPLGTSHYQIILEAEQIDAKQTFIHLGYAYHYDTVAAVAMHGYLLTTGLGKVGFSIVGKKADGKPVYISDIRGIAERNTMRYYLALDAYLGALSLPAPQQLEKRLNDWFDGIERYPRQLHEMERDEYMKMKHKEIARQQR